MIYTVLNHYNFYMKLIYIILFTIFTTSVYADWRNQIVGKSLDEISKKSSKFVSGLIPGEGVTEVEINYAENLDNNFQFKVLGVRDIIPNENSNLFTQFSLQNQEINNDDRIIGNLGFGYRGLSPDKSYMLGVNTFYDQDLTENHKRVGFGLEAKASYLDFSYNRYYKATNQILINAVNEEVLSGSEFNVASKLPYMAWTTFNARRYLWESDNAANDIRGMVYSLEMALTPSLNIDILKDDPRGKRPGDHTVKLTFVHPPRNTKVSMIDGFLSTEAFVKQNMQEALKDKVRRNNNLAIEIQGSVVVTRQ